MTEWALPTPRQMEYDQLVRDMEGDERWHRIRPFVRGGYWRNFRVKYPESGEMYSRMMMVSRRLEEVSQADADPDLIGILKSDLPTGRSIMPSADR